MLSRSGNEITLPSQAADRGEDLEIFGEEVVLKQDAVLERLAVN